MPEPERLASSPSSVPAWLQRLLERVPQLTRDDRIELFDRIELGVGDVWRFADRSRTTR